MALHPFGIASTVFLALYLIVFISTVAGYVTGRFKWKSRWTFLLIHVTVRLAAQAVGIAFDQVGLFDPSSGPSLLRAVIILSAEGYLTLVLCLMRQLMSWQRRHSPSGKSWLQGKKEKSYWKLSFREAAQRIEINLDWILAIGNVLVIVGGLLPLSLQADEYTEAWATNDKTIRTSKSLKGAGQVLLLTVTAFVVGALWHEVARMIKDPTTSRKDAELLILLLATPALLVRGSFGVWQAFDTQINYAAPYVYSVDFGGSFLVSFVIKESILATAMEWSACACLLITALFARRREQVGEAKEEVK